MIHFVANIRSGRGRALKNVKKLTDYCIKNEIDYSLHVTHRKGHAIDIARELSKEEGAIIIAVGGDGTFHEVINGIIDFSKVKVGFIPSGRGNDFARAAGFSLDPIKALNDILRGEETYFDYIQVGPVRCLNVGGTGMDVDVLKRVDGSSSKLTYLKSLIGCLSKFDPYPVEVTVNGETKSYNCLLAAICNGTCIGGNMKVSPLSKIDDNMLDLIIVVCPDANVFPLLPKFLKGKHIYEDWGVHIKCESAKITCNRLPIQLDGEIYEDLELDCHIVKNGIRTFKISK